MPSVTHLFVAADFLCTTCPRPLLSPTQAPIHTSHTAQSAPSPSLEPPSSPSPCRTIRPVQTSPTQRSNSEGWRELLTARRTNWRKKGTGPKRQRTLSCDGMKIFTPNSPFCSHPALLCCTLPSLVPVSRRLTKTGRVPEQCLSYYT